MSPRVEPTLPSCLHAVRIPPAEQPSNYDILIPDGQFTQYVSAVPGARVCRFIARTLSQSPAGGCGTSCCWDNVTHLCQSASARVTQSTQAGASPCPTLT